MSLRIAGLTNASEPPADSCDQEDDAESITDPLSPSEEPPEEPSDLDDFNGPCTDNDSRWDVFIPDDDEFDPLPDPGDFWTTQD